MRIKLVLTIHMKGMTDEDRVRFSKKKPVVLYRLIDSGFLPKAGDVVQKIENTELIVSYDAHFSEYEIIDGTLVLVLRLSVKGDCECRLFEDKVHWMLANSWSQEQDPE